MTRMMAQTVGILFKRFEWMLNVPELDPARTGSHSAGIGATHDLVEVGLSDAAMMRQAGWRTPRMVGMYARAAKAKHCATVTRLDRLSGSLQTSMFVLP